MQVSPSQIPRLTIREQSAAINMILLAAMDDMILSRVEPFGYNAERIAEGRSLFNQVEELERRCFLLNNEKQELRRQRDAAIAKAHATSGVTRKILQVAILKSSGLQQQLGIDKPREKQGRIQAWIAQHELFYRNMNSTVRSTLDQFGYNDEKIKSEYDAIVAIVEMEKERSDLAAQVKKVNVQKRTLRTELHEWISTFLKLTEIAVADTPQSMEALGILVRS